jgi:sodium/potassium-transporting ATPase subunit alpha
MTPFLVYIFLPVPLPLAIMQALAISMATDLLPALALGTEPPTNRTMVEAPEPPGRPLLTRRLGLLTFLFYGVIEAAIGLSGYFAYYTFQGWRPLASFLPFDDIHRQATAVTFLAIVGGQVGCLAAQRGGGLRQRLSLKSNRWIAFGLGFELALALILVYTPGLNGLFSADPVPLSWLVVIPLGAGVFVLADEVRRRVSR